MSSGIDHAIDSILFAGHVAIVGTLLVDKPFGIAAGVGCVVFGQLLSPDLDQDNVTESEAIVVRYLGYPGWLYFLYWFMYAKAIPHRHWISHAPVIGTVIRWLYACIGPFCIWLLLGRPEVSVSPGLAKILRGLFVGNVVSDTIHWIRDGLSTSMKRRRKYVHRSRWERRP